MVCMLASGVVDRGVEPRSGQINNKIGICYFSAIACIIKEKEQQLVGSEPG